MTADISVKICGLDTPRRASSAVKAGADMIGLVFYPPSPRHLDIATAGEIAVAIQGRAAAIGLFVNPSFAGLDEVIRKVPLTHLQLHGAETPERLRAFRDRYRLPMIKAFGIGNADDIAALAAYEDVAEFFILDAKPPKSADRPGGLGQVFDWSVLGAIETEIPWLLSGGLTPEIAGEAVAACRDLPGFAGLDVSSGVESAPGVKDEALIRRFIDAARAPAC